MIIKKCPNCKNNIQLNEVRFPGGVNDRGGIVFFCQKCNQSLYLTISNPSESTVNNGGYEVDCWDNEIETQHSFLSQYPDAKLADEGLMVSGDIKKRIYEFDYNSPHLYFCHKCNSEIETLAQSTLYFQRNNIKMSYQNLMNNMLAQGKREYSKLIIELTSNCNCGENINFFWHKEFKANGDFNLNYRELHLINTSCGIHGNKIDGIAPKSECKKILEKLVTRWNILQSHTIIATPFIGHQWMDENQIKELWDWIINYLDPKKSTLITRTATYNKYKKICAKSGIDLDLLENYGIGNKVIDDFTKKQDFHAKIYVGYSSNSAEVLMGSFNLLDGPSVENICFKNISYSQLIDNYISKMKIQIEEPKSIGREFVLHMSQGSDSELICSEKRLSEIYG